MWIFITKNVDDLQIATGRHGTRHKYVESPDTSVITFRCHLDIQEIEVACCQVIEHIYFKETCFLSDLPVRGRGNFFNTYCVIFRKLWRNHVWLCVLE